MYIYIVYFIVLFFLSLYLEKKHLESKKNIRSFLMLISIALIVLIGCRAESVGIDTSQYAYIWNYNIKAGDFSHIDTEAELGYYYLQTFFKLFIDYQSFLFLIGALSIIPICIIVYKYSKACALSILIFYSSIAFHTLEFAAARQALAFTGVVVSYKFVMERNLKGFLITLIIAVLFHQTAVIFLPSYWLYNVRIEKKTMCLWGGILLGSFILATTIFNFLNSFSRIDYSDFDTEVGGQRLFLLMLVFVFIGFIKRDTINRNPNIRMPFVLYSIAPLLWPILNSNPALYRLLYYFDFFLCFYVPNLMFALPKSSKTKIIIYSLSLLVSLYIVIYMRTSEAYYPYKFFWEK